MPRYSEERKEAFLSKTLPPTDCPLREVAAEEGIYAGRRKARARDRLLLDVGTAFEEWDAADKSPRADAGRNLEAAE